MIYLINLLTFTVTLS